MSRDTYIGVAGSARRVAKQYLGVNGIARRIKKAYIGVENTARLFWWRGDSARPPERFGPDTAFMGSNDAYAILFSSGTIYSYAYNEAMARTEFLCNASGWNGMAGVDAGGYALLGGGVSATGNVYSPYVGAVTATLTEEYLSDLTIARAHAAGAMAGEYALVLGGVGGVSTSTANWYAVDAYDSNRVRSTPTPMRGARSGAGAGSIGRAYAVVAGGYTPDAPQSSVDGLEAYTAALVRLSLAISTSSSAQVIGASMDTCALFHSVWNGSMEHLFAVDGNLNRITIPGQFVDPAKAIPGNRMTLTGAGGRALSTHSQWTTTIDANYVRTRNADMEAPSAYASAASVGASVLAYYADAGGRKILTRFTP